MQKLSTNKLPRVVGTDLSRIGVLHMPYIGEWLHIASLTKVCEVLKVQKSQILKGAYYRVCIFHQEWHNLVPVQYFRLILVAYGK